MLETNFKVFPIECCMLAVGTQNVLLFSCSVVSNVLPPPGLQHARLPGPLPSPGACSNLCPLKLGGHPTILSSVVPFSSCLQSSPKSRSFQMSQFFASGGQSIGSFSFSISPSNEYSGLVSLRVDWWISLQSKGLSRVFSNTTVQKHQFFGTQISLQSNFLIHT